MSLAGETVTAEPAVRKFMRPSPEASKACSQTSLYFTVTSLKPNAIMSEYNTAGLWVRKLDLNRGKLAQIDVGERICQVEQHAQAFETDDRFLTYTT